MDVKDQLIGLEKCEPDVLLPVLDWLCSKRYYGALPMINHFRATSPSAHQLTRDSPLFGRQKILALCYQLYHFPDEDGKETSVEQYQEFKTGLQELQVLLGDRQCNSQVDWLDALLATSKQLCLAHLSPKPKRRGAPGKAKELDLEAYTKAVEEHMAFENLSKADEKRCSEVKDKLMQITAADAGKRSVMVQLLLGESTVHVFTCTLLDFLGSVEAAYLPTPCLVSALAGGGIAEESGAARVAGKGTKRKAAKAAANGKHVTLPGDKRAAKRSTRGDEDAPDSPAVEALAEARQGLKQASRVRGDSVKQALGATAKVPPPAVATARQKRCRHAQEEVEDEETSDSEASSADRSDSEEEEEEVHEEAVAPSKRKRGEAKDEAKAKGKGKGKAKTRGSEPRMKPPAAAPANKRQRGRLRRLGGAISRNSPGEQISFDSESQEDGGESPEHRPRRLRAIRKGGIRALPKSPPTRATGSIRTKWTEEEEESLINGVKDHGVGAWATILSDRGDSFNNRSSVDLKDKWRNLSKKAEKEIKLREEEGNE
ncbi:unnamed protein product [Chrysoparadoxa australica]